MVRAVVAAVLVLLLCGACSEDPKPIRAEPTPRASQSATPTTSSDASSVPVTLGPRDTVEAWVSAQNAALTSGDTSTMRALTSSCVECDNFAASIEESMTAGGSFETAGWRTEGGRTSGTAAEPQVSLGIVMAGGTTIPSAGAEPVVYNEMRKIVRFRLTRLSGQLKITSIVFLT